MALLIQQYTIDSSPVCSCLQILYQMYPCLTFSREAQLSTDLRCISSVPCPVADTTPATSKADLYHAFSGRPTMHQPHICVIAALRNSHCTIIFQILETTGPSP